MARVKGAMMTRKRRNRIMKLAKGYFGSKSKLFRTANQAVMKSLKYAYVSPTETERIRASAIAVSVVFFLAVFMISASSSLYGCDPPDDGGPYPLSFFSYRLITPVLYSFPL